jgi:hypothetical protein
MCPPLARLQGTAVVGGDPSSNEICECSLSLVQGMTQPLGQEQCHWSDLRSGGGFPFPAGVRGFAKRKHGNAGKSQRCSRLKHANLPHKRMPSRCQVWGLATEFFCISRSLHPRAISDDGAGEKRKVVSRPVYSPHGRRRRGAVTMKKCKGSCDHGTVPPSAGKSNRSAMGVCVCA